MRYWILGVCVLFGHVVKAEDTQVWSSFLSSRHRSSPTDNIPWQWSEQSNVAWQISLPGYGQSSPVVWDGKIFVTCISGEKKETQTVVALSTRDGSTLWNHSQSTKNLGENTDYFSRAAPTPVVSEKGIVAWFETGDVVALGLDGQVKWKIDLVERFGPITSRHGLSASLAQHDHFIYLWVQRDQDPYLLCLHQDDGSLIWKFDCPRGVAWSSPLLLETTDQLPHIVISMSGASAGPNPNRQDAYAKPPASAPERSPTNEERPAAERRPTAPQPGMILGLDPIHGQKLWQIDGTFGNSTATPTQVATNRFLVGASGGREGGPSKEAIATNGLVEVRKSESGWEARYVWRSQRASCGYSSPIAFQGIAYFTDRRGRLFALDLESGEEVFNESLDHPVWATPFGAGSRVYFVGEEGMTTVIEAGRTFHKLATNSLWQSSPEPVDPANPRSQLGRTRQYAVVPLLDSLLIRRGDVLYCLR